MLATSVNVCAWLSRVVTAAAILTAVAPAPAAAQGDTRPEFVIASIGDSLGSGEGHPFLRGDHSPTGALLGNPERWDDPTNPDSEAQRCHRTPLAHSARAVRILAQRYPNVRIRFEHLACSGAAMLSSETLLTSFGEKEHHGGLLTPYSGLEPAGPGLPPQLTQLNQRLGNRRVDALIVNVGANDAGFGDVLAHCAALQLQLNCRSNPAMTIPIPKRLDALPTAFSILHRGLLGSHGNPVDISPLPDDARELASSPASLATLDQIPGHTYMVEYMDPTRNAQGNFCHRATNDPATRNLTAGEAAYAYHNVVVPLNEAVAGAAASGTALGLTSTYVGGMMQAFRTHGACSTSNWVNTGVEALRSQGADALAVDGLFAQRSISAGIVHPNAPGHAAIAERVADAIDPQIRAVSELATLAASTPSLAVRRADDAGIDLTWSIQPQAITGWELEIQDTDTPRTLAAPPIAGSLRSFSHQTGAGAFLYRIRACAGTTCSRWSPRVRGSNVRPPALGRPTDLEQEVRAEVPVVNMTWQPADRQYTYFDVAYRRLLDEDDGTDPLARRLERRLRRMIRPLDRSARREVSADLRSRRALPRFSHLFSAIPDATLPELGGRESYEVKLRACSNVACTRYTEPVVMTPRAREPRIGETELDPSQLLILPGRPARFDLTIDQPRRGLGTLDIRLTEGSRTIGLIRFDGRTGEVGLGRTPRQRRRNTGDSGSRGLLRTGDVALSLRGTRARGRSGDTELSLSLRLGRDLRGAPVEVEVGATDRRGRRQGYGPAGSILVR